MLPIRGRIHPPSMEKRTRKDYFSTYFPLSIQVDLKAAAFVSLCDHLRQRSSEVSNIDMMSVSGFCRNCLAKWLVMTARKLSVQFKGASASSNANMSMPYTRLVELLDAFGYDEAAQSIYGCSYTEWKTTYQKKATEAQLLAFETSKSIHAKHNSVLLETTHRQEESYTNSTQYFTTMLPIDIQKQLQAGAFEYLCHHLQQHSEEVSNILMMSTMGFCRNCLAKWLVLEARHLSQTFRDNIPKNTDTTDNTNPIAMLGRLLDAFGYDDAAEVVYGCTYAEWKETYHVEPTEEQLKLYQHSLHLHAMHDKETLKERVPKKDVLMETQLLLKNTDQRELNYNTSVEKGGHGIRSNVCCQTMDAFTAPTFVVPGSSTQKDSSAVVLNTPTSSNEASWSHVQSLSFVLAAPPCPPVGGIQLRIGVLTVSDRCFTDQYDSGDLSGPAVLDSIHSTVQKLNSLGSSDSRVSYDIVQRDVLPDEKARITKTLIMWSTQCNIIFTTGGTGFAPRDVTPEATTDMLDAECHGLMTWASIVCSSAQTLAPLSRGTAGIRGKCIVVNLPGSPTGSAQVTTALLPLLIHAVKDINSTP